MKLSIQISYKICFDKHDLLQFRIKNYNETCLGKSNPKLEVGIVVALQHHKPDNHFLNFAKLDSAFGIEQNNKTKHTNITDGHRETKYARA